MPVNPLERAVKSGFKMNDRIGNLFAQIGTEAHPRGDVISVYRAGRLTLKAALDEPNRFIAVQDVLRSMRRDLVREVSSSFSDGIVLGYEEATRQLSFYDADKPRIISLTDETQSALEATLARFDSQAAAIKALVITDADNQQIIGDEDRSGVLNAGEFIGAATYWASFLVWNSFDTSVRSNRSGVRFQKQAVAGLDAHTTDCCLKVHAQIQELDTPFHLTGTPRFADYMDWPGFHWYCRTSGVLYLPGYDDGLSKKMRDGADFFLKERKAGRNPDRDPADAF